MKDNNPNNNFLSTFKNHMLWDIIGHSIQSIIILNQHGIIEYVNDYFTQLTGFTAEEILGKDAHIADLTSHSQDFFDEVWACLDGGKIWSREIQSIKKTGETYWTDATIYPMNDDDLAYFLLIQKDITEKVEAQLKQQEAEKTLRNMIDAVTESLAMFDENHEILVANKTFVSRFKMTPSTTNLQHLRDILPKEAFDHHTDLMDSVFTSGKNRIDIDTQSKRKFKNLYYPVFNDDKIVDKLVIFGRDITEEIGARNALQENENLHQTILESISDAVFITDDAGDLTFISSMVKKIFDYTPQQGAPLLNISQLLPNFEFSLEELDKHNETVDIEHYIVMPSGDIKILLINIKKVNISNGTRLFTCRDITDIKHKEGTLSYNSMVLSSVSDAIVLTDMQFNVISLNPAAESIYGWNNKEAVGKNWGELVPVAYVSQSREQVLQDFADNGHWTGEVIQTNRDGHQKHIMSSVAMVKDFHNRPIGIVAINRDITDQVLANHALKVSEQRFRIAIESAPFPIILHADDGEVIMINNQWTKLTGYEHEDIPTIEAWRELAYGNKKAIGNDIISKSFKASGIIIQGIFEITTRSSQTVLWNFQSSILGTLEDGRQLVMSAAIDITEAQALQEQVTQSMILEAELKKERELSELRERLVSTISHEFRTPLTVIQTSADILSQYFEQLDTDKRHKHLDRIVGQVTYAVNLLNQTMELRHVQSGHVEFTPANIYIETFCMAIFDKMKFADNHKHAMQFFSDENDIKVKLDANLIEHILQNLLSNALKYTPSGKAIRLEVRHEENTLLLEVADEGMGIPKQDLKRLFEPYHRASNVTNIQGTGLGLAIVKEYVELHNGTITCESELDVGTRFKIRIPY